jgi:hypothetical protein
VRLHSISQAQSSFGFGENDSVRGLFAQSILQAERLTDLWDGRSPGLFRSLLNNSAPTFDALRSGGSEVSIGAARDHRQNALDA